LAWLTERIDDFRDDLGKRGATCSGSYRKMFWSNLTTLATQNAILWEIALFRELGFDIFSAE
jgi:hypothetical protein